MKHTLLKSRKYGGKYVALKDFANKTVVGCGGNPQEAYKKAVKRGYKDPVILFVPVKGMVHIYNHNFKTKNILIDFMPNLHVPLLGVKGFLNKCILTLDYPNRTFSLLLKAT